MEKIARALLSVSDKTGLVDFARGLSAQGVELISTGGTAKALREAGLKVTDVAEITQSPEMMDGRVKTLHPKIHGGLLAVRGKDSHEQALKDHAIPKIDLLAVNLYPFEEHGGERRRFRRLRREHRHRRPGADPRRSQEPCERHRRRRSWRLPARARRDGEECRRDHDGVSQGARRQGLCPHRRLRCRDRLVVRRDHGQPHPSRRVIAGTLVDALRYGENPHQWGAFYRTSDTRFGVATATQVQGKELSYNNLNDADAAYELVAEFDPNVTAAVAIIKHANPCGVAIASTLKQAYIKALRCDPESAFGGVIALNRSLDDDAARAIVEIFTEVIIAPDASDEAKAIIAGKKNLRLLLAGGLPDPKSSGLTFRSLSGGFLVQARDNGVAEADLKIVTKRTPTASEMADMIFAFTVAKHVKSNAIVYAKEGATVGIGAGQMSRVDSARMAAWKGEQATHAAGLKARLTEGSVAASDAFFPFPDGLKVMVAAGATAVIQPGGAMRDAEVIAAADEAGLAMVFTGMRHFRH